MSRLFRRPDSFTLVELLVVMVVIAILAALTLQVSGYVQKKAASSRAEAEIRAMEAGCESYKADNGTYPRSSGTGNSTDTLDPRLQGDPVSANAAAYKAASLALYGMLTGDTNGDGQISGTEVGNKSYMPFKPDTLGRATSTAAVSSSNSVLYISDPWGNSYGYSTANYAMTTGTAAATGTTGYNPTFDLWSTAGKTTTPTPGTTTDVTLQWIKNW